MARLLELLPSSRNPSASEVLGRGGARSAGTTQLAPDARGASGGSRKNRHREKFPPVEAPGSEGEKGFKTLRWGPAPRELHDRGGQGTFPGLTPSPCHGARGLPRSKASRRSPGAGRGNGHAEAEPGAGGRVPGQQAEAGSRRGSPHVPAGRQLDGVSGGHADPDPSPFTSEIFSPLRSLRQPHTGTKALVMLLGSKMVGNWERNGPPRTIAPLPFF